MFAAEWLVFGRFGVSAFFIISGYVIAYSSEGKSSIDFLASRVSRLYPALAVCAPITFVAIALGGFGGITRGALNLAAAEAFFPLLLGKGQIDPAYWSIVFELRFYAVVLLLIWLGVLRHLLTVLTVLAGLGLVLDAVAPLRPLSGFLMFPHISYFALGVLLHRMHGRGIDMRAGALTAFHLGSAAYGSYLNFETVDMLDGVRSPPWIGVPIALACFAIVAAATSVSFRPRHAGLAALAGAVSYPLYLVHQVVGLALLRLLVPGLPPALAAAAVICAVVTLALLVHLLVERRLAKPLRGLIRRLGSRGGVAATELRGSA